MTGFRAPIEERFKRFFTPGKKSECWFWRGYKTRLGYGYLAVAKHRPILAHRFSYIFYKGPISDGLHVLHACDIPACINPNHLKLGTHADNLADAKNKGRMQRGGKRWNAKLTPSRVRAIRKDKRVYAAIAAKYGVDPSLISYVKTGKIWQHIK